MICDECLFTQQMQGIGLLIHLNELLHYTIAHYRACVNVAGVLKAHALTKHVTCHIIYIVQSIDVEWSDKPNDLEKIIKKI